MTTGAIAAAPSVALEEGGKLERVLANTVLVALLFPYVSPVPIGSDVQPFGLVVAAMALGVLFLLRGHIRHLDTTDVLLLAGGYMYAFYADWTKQSLDMLFLRKNAVMLIAFPAYLATKQLYQYMSARTVLGVAWVYLGLTLLQGFVPSVFNLFSSVFMQRVAALSAERGLTGPCAEPSFLAFMAICFPLVYRLAAANDPGMDRETYRRQFRNLLVISVVLVLLARSVTGTALGMGMVGVIVLVRMRSWRRRLALVGGGLLLVLVAGALVERLVGGRIAMLLRLVATRPSLVLLDASIASRYVQILGGAYTVVANPAGTGRSVGDPEVFEAATNALGFRSYVPPTSMDYILSNRTPEGDIAVLSPFGDSLSRMGILFVALLALVIVTLRAPPASVESRVFLMFGIVSSFPLSFHPFWLLLGMHAGWSWLRATGRPHSSSLAG